MITKIPEVKRGAMLVIRSNGQEEDHNAPSIGKIRKLIEADCLDSVSLSRSPTIVMMVDDTGMCDGKPVNAKATALYQTRCQGSSPYSIHGDVCLVNDEDFA
jgi:hypothetical protein